MPAFADSSRESASWLLLDQRREAPQEARAVGRRDGAPGREGRLRAGDGGVGLLDARLLELRDRLLGGGIEDGERHRA